MNNSVDDKDCVGAIEPAANRSAESVRTEADCPVSRFEAMRGRAGPGPSTDEIMAMSRGED